LESATTTTTTTKPAGSLTSSHTEHSPHLCDLARNRAKPTVTWVGDSQCSLWFAY